MLEELSLSQYLEWANYLFPDTRQSPAHISAILQGFAYAHNRQNKG